MRLGSNRDRQAEYMIARLDPLMILMRPNQAVPTILEREVQFGFFLLTP